MICESVEVWKHGDEVILGQLLVEDGVDLSTQVYISAQLAPWVRDTLALFVENWQTPEQQQVLHHEKVVIFSAGNEMDPRVGIQSEHAGKSFSMITRLPLAGKLVQLLSGEMQVWSNKIPETAPSVVSDNKNHQEKPGKISQEGKQPPIIITNTECRDPLGDPAETVEITCGEVSYWAWNPEELLKQLSGLQLRLSMANSEDRKSEILLEDDSYLLPGNSAIDKEQTLNKMVTQLENRFGRKRKKR